MNRHGFLNLVLVFSFVFSNLGGATANLTTITDKKVAWNLNAFFETLGARIEELFLEKHETEELLIIKELPTSAPTPVFGIPLTIEPTQTVVPTQTLTQTLEPKLTPTQTLEPTLTPTLTLEPTLTPTQTLEPTLTPTIAPTETITPTEIVTPTVTPPEGGFQLAILEVNLNPDPAAPGDVVTATWTIHNYHGQYDGMEVWLYLPDAFIPLDTGGGTFNQETNLLVIPIDSANGLISWYIDGNAQPGFNILVQIQLKGRVIMSVTRTLGLRSPDFVPTGGGEANGFNHRVKAIFPAGAINEDADVTVRAPKNIELSLGGQPMEFTAIGRVSGKEITQFSQPVTISVQYSDEDAARQLEHAGMKDERSLTIFYYDVTKKAWYPLPTIVDSIANKLTAITYHFSLFDYQAQNWEAARLPSLDGFQLSGFTGAATYSFPIQVPPGPGGLQPNLELSYNTQEVDSSSARTQASWVGMGWSLDTGYIKRNMNGTPNYLGDDTFTLVMNGIGGVLLPIADQDGDPNTIDYHFANEAYWQIRQYLATGNVGGYQGDYSKWVVFSPDGTQYYFGNYSDGSLGGHAWYPSYPDQCNTVTMETWQWSLTRIRNVFGKELTFTYFYEYLPKYGNGCSGLQAYMQVAVYPDSIIYPNGRYRVVFVRDTNGQGQGLRTDYDLPWKETVQSTMLFMQSTLKRIQIWNDPNGIWSSGDEILIRKYELVYGENNQQVFPGVTWPAGGKTPTLTSITEYGLNGTNSLPRTTFKYWDMHLKSMENGYGGKQDYYVDSWRADNGYESYLFSPDVVYNKTGEWYPDEEGSNELDDLKNYYQPGGYYKLTAVVRQGAGSSIQLGLDEGGGIKVYGSEIYLNPWQWTTVTIYVGISGAARQARALIKCNATCDLDWYEVFPLVTRYRITQKTITDQVSGSAYTTLYSYDGAAVNDTTHSNYVAVDPGGEHLMTKPNTEFRGHSHVTETDPDGRTVETWYYQDDIYKGKAYKTQVKDNAGNLYTESDITFASQENSTYNLPHPEGQPADSDLKILWVYTTSEEDRTYLGSPSYIATRMDYQYYPSDQGGVQYGNRTRTTSFYWNGISWVVYRGSMTRYYPKLSNGSPVDSRYLTGMPGYTNTFKCPTGCDWTAANLINSQWYLYDGNTMFNMQPVDGKLTGNRTMIYYATPPTTDPMYADTIYTYDTWGNRTMVTRYAGYTGMTSFSTDNHPQTTYTCYGGGGSLNGHACSDDGYYTYPAWERNALDQPTTFDYDKTKSVPQSLKDPNDATTSATYDDFGRILTIVRPGDNISDPTIKMSYHEASAPFLDKPFWTEAQQRITLSTYFIMRKYYNGMGQLLQTQMVGVTIGSLTHDILADTFYDAGGRVSMQSISYDVATGSNYHPRNTSAAHTTTTYNILGWITNSLATDGTPTTYSYSIGYMDNIPYLDTTVTNSRNNSTTTRSDIWGRVVLVTPPTGPTVSYTYDAADRLQTTTRGGITTTLSYDFGGRKTNMDDPDMGAWAYAYDALGNLTRQTDARGQRICLYYDGLNRLKGKNYRSDNNCPTDPSYPNYTTAYYYDEGGSAAYEIGRRTRMVDVSGSTAWDYDSRGRLIMETKAITGSGTFVTQWGYNSADLMISMTYPSNNSGGPGEVVNYTYLNQLLLDTVTGTNTYINNTDYDASGRVDMRDLGVGGGNPVIREDYTYFDWTDANGQGRLKQITSGIMTNLVSLQDLRYSYDAMGNVLTIKDYKAGSPQTQTFTYDELDRLTSGQASGGNGGTYSLQNYDYNSTTGNLSSRAGVSYTYGDANHDHAVTAMSSGENYSYDANGNQSNRVTVDYSPNLAPDPGFESGGSWSEAKASEFPGMSFYRSNWGTAAPHSGGNAYAISNHAYGYLESDLINIRSNTQYDLYAYVRGELDAEDSEGGWLIRAYFYDSSNNYISYQDAASGGAGTLTTSWQYTGGRITTPANAAKLRILLFDYMNSGWVAFDDVELYKIARGSRSGSNLAPNPGFENTGSWSEVRDSQFPGTSFYRSNGGTATPHNGSYAYAISNQAYGYLDSGFITIQPNAQYDLYAYVRGELDPEDSEGGGWLIRAYFYDSSNNPISYQEAAGGGAGTLITSWQYMGGRITTPANAAKMRIQLYDYMNSGWVTFDDVELYTIISGNRSGSNLAPDPGFENGGTWSELRLSQYPGTSFYRSNWGTATPHSGGYAYAISNHAYGALQAGFITIQPNAQYDLYAYVRGELDAEDSEGGGWLIRAYFYDSSNNYISYQDAAGGGAGTLTTSWQYMGGRVTTPANAANVLIHLYNYMSSGWVAYDDVSLKLVGNYQLTNDAENRLVGVSGAVIASFVYDGDGNRVKGTVSGTTTAYLGNYFEWTGLTSTMKSYYYAGSTRVAMRTGSSTLNFLLGDHLGSTAITTDNAGGNPAEVRYYPWGTKRWSSGAPPTSFMFTGQRWESSLGLYFYGARWYDSAAGRFIQPDPDVPESQDTQVLDRYIYAGNNPIKYVDKSGHCWGIASGLRGLPIYNITCKNLDMALSIVQNPNANFGEKALAGGYIAIEATAHAALALGTTALACSAIAPCVNTVEAALGIGTSVWSLDPLDRGWEIENLIGRGSLLRNLPGFPTIDRFENGIATSIKSIDLGANTYLNIKTLTSTVQGYINDLASFPGAKYGGVNIANAIIEGRELILAIPGNASAEQMKALQQLVLDAMNQGINLILQVIK